MRTETYGAGFQHKGPPWSGLANPLNVWFGTYYENDESGGVQSDQELLEVYERSQWKSIERIHIGCSRKTDPFRKFDGKVAVKSDPRGVMLTMKPSGEKHLIEEGPVHENLFKGNQGDLGNIVAATFR
jgi:hypothetical protein